MRFRLIRHLLKYKHSNEIDDLQTDLRKLLQDAFCTATILPYPNTKLKEILIRYADRMTKFSIRNSSSTSSRIDIFEHFWA